MDHLRKVRRKINCVIKSDIIKIKIEFKTEQKNKS